MISQLDAMNAPSPTQLELFTAPSVSESAQAGVFAEIVFDRPLDHAYSYRVPDELAGSIAIGKRVQAPFGKGDRATIKKLVNSSELMLWNKVPRKMLAIERSQVPQKLSLVSKQPFKKYQYNYMILKLTGVTKKGIPKRGVVMMLVENGEWKVEARKWDPNLSFDAIVNQLTK